MLENWDLLARKLIDELKDSLPSLLLASAALLILLATAWLFSPSLDSAELMAFVSPTASPTCTRVVVTRQATPTSFILTVTPEPLIHVVLEGEVLGLIAEEYDTTVEAILEANSLDDVDLLSVGQELIIAGAKRTPVVTVIHTPSPTATPTPAFPHTAPILLAPADRAAFRGREARIALQWTSTDVLGGSEWYEVRVWLRGQGDVYRVWTKASSWTVPASLHPGDEGNLLYWDVSVVQRTGQQVIPQSPRSPTRRFGWY